MIVFIFLVLLIGLFGVYLAQYIIQYREAYKLWIETIVYGADIDDCEKKQLCSQIESYSRELCGLADIIRVLFYSLCITFIVILCTIRFNIVLVEYASENFNAYLASGVLSGLSLLVGIPLILHYSHINIYKPLETSPIDEDLFSVWNKLECHYCKEENYINKLEPSRLYEVWAEMINRDDITPTDKEKELLQSLLHDEGVYTQS